MVSVSSGERCPLHLPIPGSGLISCEKSSPGGCLQGILRFMESLDANSGVHWDHERWRVGSAGFRACGFGRLSSRPFGVHRTRKSGEPAGWKVCATSRFMESLLSFFRMHWDHEPIPNETAPPRCCRHLAGSAFLRLFCRQDAGSTLGFMERPAPQPRQPLMR